VAIAASPSRAEPARSAAHPVVFVCEHGNVKSLMAASYFNRLAEKRGLVVRAIARGAAPNSTEVPAPIQAGLRADGIDVSAFHPEKLSQQDLSGAGRVVWISTALPPALALGAIPSESWTNVPPASDDFAAARRALLENLEALLREISRP
jgi:protein-tyrosine-phosphatase